MSVPKWQYRLERVARKQFAKLSPKDRARVLRSIEQLASADNPAYLPGLDLDHVESSQPKQWRLRTGRWRIFYEMQPGKFIELEVEYKGWLIIHDIQLDHRGY
jgi:mRNA-degrading endonuclease RelE of RelBE toxin-antitoxin system